MLRSRLHVMNTLVALSGADWSPMAGDCPRADRTSSRTVCPQRGRDPRLGIAPILLIGGLVGLMLSAAFLVDLGLLVARRAQIQAEADDVAVALALGRSPAEQKQRLARTDGRLAVDSIDRGRWDASQRQFVSSGLRGDAVRVSLRAANNSWTAHTLLFGRWWSQFEFSGKAAAVARVVPRDFCFVVDLSGAMNDLSSPLRTPTDSTTHMRAVESLYDDLRLGSFPGVEERLGTIELGDGRFELGESVDPLPILSAADGPLCRQALPVSYRVLPDDSADVRRSKAYAALIELQLSRVLRHARPAPSLDRFEFWRSYIDYLRHGGRLSEIYGTAARPAASSRAGAPALGEDCAGETPWPVGNRSYVQFLLDLGRDRKPDGIDYAPLSVHHPACPAHWEIVGDRLLSFLAREQPMHAVRRSLAAAIIELDRQNTWREDETVRDRTALVGFDCLLNGGPIAWHALNSDNAAALVAAGRLQAAGETQTPRPLDAGLQTAAELLAGSDAETTAAKREKIVVVILAGVPQSARASGGAVDAWAAGSSSPVWSEAPIDHPQRAALVQVERMRQRGWKVYVVSVLPAANRFAHLLAQMAGHDQALIATVEFVGKPGGASTTAAIGRKPSLDPQEIERRLTAMLLEIIARQEAVIVQ